MQRLGPRTDVAFDLDARERAREVPVRLSQILDERLARQVAGGNRRAFASIYERYHQELYSYCYSLLRDREDAFDALQSTLANAFAALQRGQRDAPLRPWLFRIAHAETVSLARRRAEGSARAPTSTLAVPSAEERAAERARLDLLVADLNALSERERSVLLMRELSGLSHREIALAQGISVHTVKHAILAARRSLREFAQGRATPCADVRTGVAEGHGNVRRTRAHLRSCPACAEFAAASRTRRADLQALVPPLSPATAAGLLAALHGAASSSGVAAGGGGAGIAGTSVAGKSAYAALVAKALAGVTAVAIAGAGAADAVGLKQAARGGGPQTTHRVSGAHHRRGPSGVHALRRAHRHGATHAGSSAATPLAPRSRPADAGSAATGAAGAVGGDRDARRSLSPAQTAERSRAAGRSARQGEQPASTPGRHAGELRSANGPAHSGGAGGGSTHAEHAPSRGVRAPGAEEHAEPADAGHAATDGHLLSHGGIEAPAGTTPPTAEAPKPPVVAPAPVEDEPARTGLVRAPAPLTE